MAVYLIIRNFACNKELNYHFPILTMKRLLTLASIALLSLSVCAQTAKEKLLAQPERAFGNYFAYPGPQGAALTPAPKGYKPFYLSHYGRHGSRYLTDAHPYDMVQRILEDANREGKLTAKGRELLEKVTIICNDARNRYGELTPLGAQQHRGIARRMMENFPEVFADSACIEARSTVVIRCILSMENGLQELISMNPKLKVFHDASRYDMYYMNQMDSEDKNHYVDSMTNNAANRHLLNEYKRATVHPERLLATLFTDTAWVNKQEEGGSFYEELFGMASDVQDTELRGKIDILNLFTPVELHALYKYYNYSWYIGFGASPVSGGVAPYGQTNLLLDIMNKADSCIALPHPGATLRYGHDTMVTPLACLLGVNGWDRQIDDPDDLERYGWTLDSITPMATNIQFVFYRRTPQDKDVLFKVLFCEHEATLPLKAVSGPYYRWSDFKAYYKKKLENFKL